MNINNVLFYIDLNNLFKMIGVIHHQMVFIKDIICKARQRCQQINKVYAILSHPACRKAYDQKFFPKEVN